MFSHQLFIFFFFFLTLSPSQTWHEAETTKNSIAVIHFF